MADWGKILSRGNVEDRRGMAPALGGIGVVGVAIALVLNLLSGGSVNVNQLLDLLQNVQIAQQSNVDKSKFEGEDSYEVFASTVLGSNNDMWKNIFEQSNQDYVEPKLVLFRTATKSACGTATSQIGPHYCPVDQTIYLDETFFDELTKRFGAQGGDVAEAYVIGHEVGHHAQNLLGILDKVHSDPNNNDLSIKAELQADCFAGLWAHSIKNLNVFTAEEFHEAMDAAEAVGDDRIQEKATGRINPEDWTHGSSQDRKTWLSRGYEQGNLNACETFE